MSEPGDPPLPAPRASDADREHAVEVLRGAASDGRLMVDELEERVGAAYAARTREELERLTADLSPAPSTSPSPSPRSGVAVSPGPGGSRWIVSIMSGQERRGRWRLAPRCTVLNVMGGSEIDLNDAELSDAVVRLDVYSVMGGAEVHVPDGIDVQVSKIGVFGGNDVQLDEEVVPAGAPSIHLRLVSIMGGVKVRRGRMGARRERGLDSPHGPRGEIPRPDR